MNQDVQMAKGGADGAEIIREPVAYHRLRLVPGARHSRCPLAGIFEFIRLNPGESDGSFFIRREGAFENMKIAKQSQL